MIEERSTSSEDPPPFKGEVVFSHIGEDTGPETSRSHQLQNFTPSAVSKADFLAIKTESLSHARLIASTELSAILFAMNATE